MEQWYKVASVTDVEEGLPFVADVGDVPIALYLLAGEYLALGDICPHRGDVRLSGGYVEDGTVECPLHQSRFSIRTGEVLSPPARQDVATYQTRVEEGEIYVEL